jgi:hypothetical protein
MKEYHVVLEGRYGFRRENVYIFPNDLPAPSLYIRDYQEISSSPFIFIDASGGESLKVRDRCFRQKCNFYALGKNIVYYTEE